MRMSKLGLFILLPAFLPQMSGCYPWVPRTSVPSARSAADPDSRARLILKDGREVELRGIWHDSTGVSGFPSRWGEPISVPDSAIVLVEMRRFSFLRTVFLALGIYSTLVLFQIGYVA